MMLLIQNPKAADSLIRDVPAQSLADACGPSTKCRSACSSTIPDIKVAGLQQHVSTSAGFTNRRQGSHTHKPEVAQQGRLRQAQTLHNDTIYLNKITTVSPCTFCDSQASL